MTSPTISIIVPIYNAEKYLKNCLDSILKQSFTDWECILVNDASPDAVGGIISEYQKRDCRFIVINNEVNEGVSRARQVGLDKAIGKYVIHADPDDRVDVDWLKELYMTAEKEKAEMVICDFERIYANRRVVYKQKPTSLSNEDIIEDMLMKRLWGCCWNKLVLRECFRRLNVRFHPNMNLWEDLYVTCKLLEGGIRVSYVPKVLYYYDSVINPESIVMHRKMAHVKSAMIFIDEFSAQLTQPRYKEGWYGVKKTVKSWLFRINATSQEMRDIYGDINERLISEAKNSSLFSFPYCLALSVKGYPKLAHFLYAANLRVHKLLHK